MFSLDGLFLCTVTSDTKVLCAHYGIYGDLEMECLTLTNEQWLQLLDVLVVDSFITVFLAMLTAFVVWDVVGFLLRRFRVMLRARQLKWLRDNTQN